MGAWNIFRILGDLSHMASKIILITAIHRNRSAEGVSLITQAMYGLVFLTRYLDIFHETILWNFLFKVIYIGTSIYTIFIMQFKYPRTRERELSWKLGSLVLGGSLALSPFVMMIFEKKAHWSFFSWLWVFSEILESVCVLPQLLLLRQTTVPTVIDSFYLVALGSYRALYCLNWLVREFDATGRRPDTVSVIFGIIQTALYIDFAWVYYTRQRVKLRAGGVVDADDLRRGWFLRRVFGNNTEDEDEESRGAFEGANGHGGGGGGGGGGGNQNQSRPKWGSRGISVSADHDTFAAEGSLHSEQSEGIEDNLDPDAKLQDPDDLAKALDDDDDDEDTPLQVGQSSGIRNGDEWRE